MDTVAQSADGTVFGERFQCVKTLKVGCGTATLLGRDLHRGTPVVIKTAVALAPDARERLEHEARVLSDLAGPDFTPILAFGRRHDVTYVVMPFVPGVTLRERLARGALSLPETLIVGRALAGALTRAHERGILHRDIKPGNIMVDEGRALSRATLIDFGFARSAGLDASIRDIPVGTVHYLAPEQAGLLSRPVDERADLYAAGIALFECAAGRVPFPGPSVGEVLRAHLCAQPPELRALGCDVPRSLDEIIQRLLRKDPEDRYQTASALLADLGDLTDALARGMPDPVVVVGRCDRRRTLAEPAFVGREKELALLDREFARAREGRGGAVLVEAESGGGKTRLLDEFAGRCARAGAWVLRGQAVDQAAVRPFQLLDGVIHALVERVESDPGFGERLREILGEHREAVCEAVPALAAHLRPRTALSLGHEAHGEVRSLRALSALLDGLGTPERPVVMVLDDAQWADDLTLKWLESRQRQVDQQERPVTTGHVLLVVAFRREEVPVDHRLRRIANSATLLLEPFSATDLRRLSESMAGRLPDEAVDLIVRLASGSPFMATAVLQGLVEIGALVPDGAGGSTLETPAWRIDQHVMEDIRSSHRAAVFLARRLDRLPPAALKLLSVGAVLGKEFALSLAGDLAGLPEHDAASGCQEASWRHLIWIHENGARCVFVHDKIREALLTRLADEERRRLHASAAEKIEAEDKEKIFELAYHFDAAGQSERALPYAIRAAEEARARYVLEVAEQQYRIAERGVPGHNIVLKGRVAEGLGDVLMLRGWYAESEQYLEAAASAACDVAARTRIQLKRGELAFKRGNISESIRLLEDGLRLLGRGVSKRPLSLTASFIWEIVVQVLHTLVPSFFLARKTLVNADLDLIAIRLYSRLAYSYYFRSPVLATLAHLRELNLAERYPPTRELGQAYSNHIPCMGLLPWVGRGIRYAERSLKIRKELGDLWGQGQTQGFLGFLLLTASRFKEARGVLGTASEILDRTGDQWESVNVRVDTAIVAFRLGDLQTAVELSRNTYMAGAEIGQPKAFAESLAIWARASGGRVPQELVAAEERHEWDDIHTQTLFLQTKALRALGEGKLLHCKAFLEQACHLMEQAGILSDEVASIPVWLTTALRTVAQSSSPFSCKPRRETLEAANKSIRKALRVARRYRNNLPHALREAGLLAAMRGKCRKARRYLDESLAVAEQQGAKFEHAQTLWARGQVGSAVGWADAAADLEQGRAALRSLGAYWVLGEAEPSAADRPVTPALIERFDALLQAGRRIASAMTRDAIYTSVRDAALALLRGDECRFLVVRDGVISETGAQEGYSRTVVERAIHTRRPEVATVGVKDEPSESMVLAGVRSVLCAPIAVRGEVVACLYVSHRRVDGLFGPDEERMAEFLATLAGAALENAEGVAKAESQLIASSVAGLAHAIKNPVAVLRAYLGLLRHAPGRERGVVDGYLQTMEGALDRIGELVSHLQRVQVTASQKAPMPLDRVIAEAIAEVRPLFSAERGYRVECEVAANAPTLIVADSEQLRLVIVNLLVNANQAMPRGGCVRIAVRSDEGCGVEIVITDEGAGISPSVEPRLFEPFVTSKPEGTGLGLWVCRKIVEEQHQGRIEVTSVSGGGTRVRVTLPAGLRAGASAP